MIAPFLIPASIGLLKIILLSGLLYTWYVLFLRNKPFHRFNRLFLLSIPVLSIIIPMTPLPISQYIQWPSTQATQPAQPLHPITAGTWQESDIPTHTGHSWLSLPSWQTAIIIVYIIVTALLLFNFARQLRYIRRLAQKYPAQKMFGIRLFNTSEPDTPFSFLKNIFWNDQLDLHSPLGRQIFRHELNHVRQKHSMDLLFLRPLMAFCWINPFFYFIHREIKIIHEFLADDEAVATGDPCEYAESLVWHTVRNPSVSLLHPFFYSPIKRRINMITRLKTRTTLLGRALTLPLLLLLVCAFGTRHTQPNVRIIASAKPVTVVIDAGHGGIDPGAIDKNGIREKDINLALAEKINTLAHEYNVRVLMTRTTDVLAGNKPTIRESLVYRADMANENKADLFIAIHTDMQPSLYVKGFNIYVAENNAHYDQCVALGSMLTTSLQKTYATDMALKKRKENIYVLHNTGMPAVLVSFGNMANEDDLSFIRNENNQEKVAKDILEGIRKYADSPLSHQ
jgi:N-acetylmuramoyl-L-alanine amidase